MHVLVVSSTDPTIVNDTSEQTSRRFLQQLKRCGHQVRVIAGTPSQAPEKRSRRRVAGCEIITIPELSTTGTNWREEGVPIDPQETSRFAAAYQEAAAGFDPHIVGGIHLGEVDPHAAFGVHQAFPDIALLHTHFGPRTDERVLALPWTTQLAFGSSPPPTARNFVTIPFGFSPSYAHPRQEKVGDRFVKRIFGNTPPENWLLALDALDGSHNHEQMVHICGLLSQRLAGQPISLVVAKPDQQANPERGVERMAKLRDQAKVAGIDLHIETIHTHEFAGALRVAPIAIFSCAQATDDQTSLDAHGLGTPLLFLRSKDNANGLRSDNELVENALELIRIRPRTPCIIDFPSARDTATMTVREYAAACGLIAKRRSQIAGRLHAAISQPRLAPIVFSPGRYGGLRFSHTDLLAIPRELTAPKPLDVMFIPTVHSSLGMGTAMHIARAAARSQIVLAGPNNALSIAQHQADINNTTTTVVSVPKNYRNPLLKLETDDHPRSSDAYRDLAEKSFIAAIFPRLLGLTAAGIVDDDIHEKSAKSIIEALGLLDRYPLVAWGVTEAEDHSAVYSAYRLSHRGLSRRILGTELSDRHPLDRFIGGGAIAFRTDTSRLIGPFARIYNLDLFALLTHLATGEIALDGEVRQQLFSAFTGRPRSQEFGDLVWEGTAAWLHDLRDGRHNLRLDQLGISYWDRMIDARMRVLEEVMRDLDRARHAPERKRLLNYALIKANGASIESIRAEMNEALGELDDIPAEECHNWIQSFCRSDRVRWKNLIAGLPRFDRAEQAWDHLELEPIKIDHARSKHAQKFVGIFKSRYFSRSEILRLRATLGENDFVNHIQAVFFKESDTYRAAPELLESLIEADSSEFKPTYLLQASSARRLVDQIDMIAANAHRWVKPYGEGKEAINTVLAYARLPFGIASFINTPEFSQALTDAQRCPKVHLAICLLFAGEACKRAMWHLLEPAIRETHRFGAPTASIETLTTAQHVDEGLHTVYELIEYADFLRKDAKEILMKVNNTSDRAWQDLAVITLFAWCSGQVGLQNGSSDTTFNRKTIFELFEHVRLREALIATKEASLTDHVLADNLQRFDILNDLERAAHLAPLQVEEGSHLIEQHKSGEVKILNW